MLAQENAEPVLIADHTYLATLILLLMRHRIMEETSHIIGAVNPMIAAMAVVTIMIAQEAVLATAI